MHPSGSPLPLPREGIETYAIIVRIVVERLGSPLPLPREGIETFLLEDFVVPPIFAVSFTTSPRGD